METLDYLASREIGDKLDSLMDALSRGAVADYPEYCKLVGEIQGLRFAQQALAVARTKTGEDDEDG